MSQQNIDLGDGPDSNTGDDLRTAFTKTNENFTELYSVLDANGVGNIQANTITANSNFITTGNTRTGNLTVQSNAVVTGNVFAASFYYANGTSVFANIVANVDIGAVNVNLVPSSPTLNVGLPSQAWSNVYANTSVIINGVALTTTDGNLYVDGNIVAGTYANSNVADFLPTYTGNLTAGNILTDNYYFSNGTPFVSYGNTDVANYLPEYAGNIAVANLTSTNTTFYGNVVPGANITYNLGSDTARWNDLFLNNSTIYIGDAQVSANADAIIFKIGRAHV